MIIIRRNLSKMSENAFLKRLFRAYYEEHKADIPIVNSFEQREFGMIPWEKQIMIRHMGFRDGDYFREAIIQNAPRHLYSSGSLYLQPDVPEMSLKEYQGCDLIIDIDVDHFYTPCKDAHDFWYCKECKNSGKGMIEACTKCGSHKIRTLAWICDDCLETSKGEILKLVYDFLIPDFGIKEEEMHIAFSGHRGYHLKVENDGIRTLSSEARREIVDYVTGETLNFELLGLTEKSSTIYGLSKSNVGWSQKIVNSMIDLLNKPNNEIKQFLSSKANFNEKVITNFLNYKDDFRQVLIQDDHNIWSMEGFQLIRWKHFLEAIAEEIGAEIDEPVSIDIHRLIRYPGSLHGKTGFKVQELDLNQLEDYTPLDESDEMLDPIIFQSKNMQKLEITELFLPITKLKGGTYGPYEQGDLIEVPHHVAIFLLSKEVARLA